MGRSYTDLTLKLLFGSANTCAWPECTQPLVLWDRGRPTVIAEIAHIRSEKSSGPRYDPQYSGYINGFENLLLLCGIHHKPVDRHDSLYETSELERWKSAQVAQPGQLVVSEDLVEIARQVHLSLQKLTTVDFTVALHGGLGVEQFGVVPVPLNAMAESTVDEADGETYLGVIVVNRGLVPVTVAAAGIEEDLGAGEETLCTYLFPEILDLGQRARLQSSKRLDGHSHNRWYTSTPILSAGIREIWLRTGRKVHRIRAFARTGSGTPAHGQWHPADEVIQALISQRPTARDS